MTSLHSFVVKSVFLSISCKANSVAINIMTNQNASELAKSVVLILRSEVADSPFCAVGNALRIKPDSY